MTDTHAVTAYARTTVHGMGPRTADPPTAISELLRGERGGSLLRPTKVSINRDCCATVLEYETGELHDSARATGL